MSARGRVTRRGGGRTHRSAPTRGGGGVWEPTGIGAERCLSRRAEQPGGGVWSPRPTGASPVVPSEGPMWASAPTKRRESCIDHQGQRRRAERLRRGRKGWVGIAAEIIPKGAINAGQSLSQPAADGSLCTREPWGTGVTDCHVALLLAMTVLILCHSEEAQRADVGIRPFYDGRGFGPPHERRGERHAESSCPTESPINHPSQPARHEASAPAGARGWAGIDARTIPKGGPPPRPPGQRLAKRKARKE